MLEQNESIVTWIAPRGVESVTEQIPVIRISGQYYSISLRMMKAIWRHVRLARDFVNTDVSKDGRTKLRIPVKLFSEKKRTQNRFNVSLPPLPVLRHFTSQARCGVFRPYGTSGIFAGFTTEHPGPSH